jgi:hypothetical protein
VTFLTEPEVSALLGRKVESNAIGAVLILFMALLSFGGISTLSLPAQGEQRRSSNFNIQLGNPQTQLIRRSHNFALDAPRIHDIRSGPTALRFCHTRSRP